MISFRKSWVASVVNLKYINGAIGNIESYAQAIYGYDVSTEVIGSWDSILIGRLNRAPMTILTACGGTQSIADHFLTAFAGANPAEIQDFVNGTLHDRPARVTGEEDQKRWRWRSRPRILTYRGCLPKYC